MKKSKWLLAMLAVILSSQLVSAQNKPAKDADLVQFSGIVVNADSLEVLPLVSIRIKATHKGTYSDPSGFFSFVARKGDTVMFTSIGLKPVEYVIPSGLKSYRYSIVLAMTEDTVYLPTTIVRPWPTPEEFNYYFVKANIPDDALYRARANTNRRTLSEISNSMSMDGRESYNNYMQQQAYKYYYNGQLPPQRLFDPFAWSEFFNAWKRGDYKKKD